MSEYLDPTGRSTYGIGICDRCHEKFFLEELFSDPNSPGLKVCMEDLDEYDPYRLPARQTENISLPFTRPDTPLIPEAENGFKLVLGTEDGQDAVVTEEGEFIELEGLTTGVPPVELP